MARIALLIRTLRWGGAERAVLDTARGLVDRGNEVDIVLFDPELVFPNDLPRAARLIVLSEPPAGKTAAGTFPQWTLWRPERAPRRRLAALLPGLITKWSVTAPAVLYSSAPKRVLRLTHYFERERPDVVIANLPAAEYAAQFAARLVDPAPRIVIVLHGVVFPGGKKTKRRRLLLSPDSSSFVAVSKGVRKSACATLGVPETSIPVIYNPAGDVRKARRYATEVPNHPWFNDDGPPIVLSAGRLEKEKDFGTLIDAFSLMQQVKFSYRLVVLGEGRMRSQLESRVAALGLRDRVSLPGFVENPFAYMARAAIFVLSSRHEAFGNVLVEAMACGCPTVSTNCPGGPSEILEDPDLLAPVGDPEALAKVMLRTLARPVDRAALRAKAARFSVSRTVDGYEKLIARL